MCAREDTSTDALPEPAILSCEQKKIREKKNKNRQVEEKNCPAKLSALSDRVLTEMVTLVNTWLE